MVRVVWRRGKSKFLLNPERSRKKFKWLKHSRSSVRIFVRGTLQPIDTQSYMVSRKLVQRTNAWLNRYEFFYTHSWVNGLFLLFHLFPERPSLDQKLR